MSTGSGRGVETPGIEALSIRELRDWVPDLEQRLREAGIPVDGHPEASLAFLCEEAGVDVHELLGDLSAGRAEAQAQCAVQRLTVVGGTDKDGRPEPVERLVLQAGQAVALVGATGSGKSQVLDDVESMAAGDSPSGRVVLLDGEAPGDELRWSPSFRPIAQVSQGMRYLLDMKVGPFLQMHASVRGVKDPGERAAEVVEAACGLCGEPFATSTQLAALSGGQSRALMIADAALLSQAPIILVDEIENAGIDRQVAVQFLVGRGKIALIATHDPLLALRADRRVIMRNGAMQAVLERSDQEAEALRWLEAHEGTLGRMRNDLRAGKRL
jgi:ABC-type lipoprotein export system ATPase subunit